MCGSIQSPSADPHLHLEHYLLLYDSIVDINNIVDCQLQSAVTSSNIGVIQ